VTFSVFFLKYVIVYLKRTQAPQALDFRSKGVLGEHRQGEWEREKLGLAPSVNVFIVSIFPPYLYLLEQRSI